MSRVCFQQRLLSLQDDLLGFALRLTEDYQDAQDLVQDTFLKVLDNREGYQQDANFRGWVFTVMRNIFLNNYRRMMRDQALVSRVEDPHLLAVPNHEEECDSIEHAYDAKEIHHIVRSLSKESRVPFALFVAGFKYREIARRLGLPMGTVKSRIFLVRKRLRKELADFR